MSEGQKLMETLLNLVKSQDELFNHREINKSVIGLLRNSFCECINRNDKNQDERKVLEVDSVLDFLHDELNTGHWSNVPLYTRQCFSAASFVKCLVILKNSRIGYIELLQKCLKCLDIGLLLGAPLEENSELLTMSAGILMQEINKSPKHDCEMTSSKTVSFKRKIDDSDKCSYEKLKGKEIQSTDQPSLEYFNKKYFIPQIPIKIKGCMEYWPATKKWLDINYFLSIAGDRTIPVEIGSHYVDENWSQKLMTLKEFIKNHYLEQTDNIGYLAQHNLFEQIPELKDDICIPDYCSLSLDYDNSTDPDINAWFGPKGTLSPLHYDPKNNILAQIFGTKQLVLFSPQDSAYLYPHEESLLFNTAQVNPLQPNFEKYPRFSKATVYKCLLEPGEMLFIPTKWWHHVTALDKSFSVSFWWQ